MNIAGDQHIAAYQLLNHIPHTAVALTLNRPAHLLIDRLHAHSINVQGMSFVDMVAKHIQSPLELSETTYLTEPLTLGRIDALLEKHIGTPKQRQLLFVDALHDLLNYYDEPTVLRFVDHLIDKAHSLRLNPIFLLDSTKTSKKFSRKINQVTDKTFDLSLQ